VKARISFVSLLALFSGPILQLPAAEDTIVPFRVAELDVTDVAACTDAVGRLALNAAIADTQVVDAARLILPE